MAIMVGGGLTFAIPGMEPAHAAQIDSNPNLKVSAEGQNADNEIASTNIIEVVIIDDLNSGTDDSMPIVTVDGTTITLNQFSGAWYAYFADIDIQYTGLIEEAEDDDDVTKEIGDAEQTAIDLFVTGAPTFVPARDDLVQFIDLDGEFDVVYERPGGNQVVSMELDNPDSGVSLDRNNYPQNTGVVITIDDMALNVDPTGPDTWTFGTNGQAQFYDTADGLSGIVDVAKYRNGNITAANDAYDKEIDGAQFDRAEAERELDAAVRLADEVLDNPIADPDDKIRLAIEYGQGDRDESSGITTIDELALIVDGATVTFDSLTVPDVTDFDTIDDDYKGLRQSLFEAEYGVGDRTSDIEGNDEYKGTALIEYQRVFGEGDRDENSSDSDDYKGVALLRLETVVGNGDADKDFADTQNDYPVNTNGILTPVNDPIIPVDELPTNGVPDDYKGSAQINYDLALLEEANMVTGNTVTAELEPFGIDTNNILACATDACTPTDKGLWVTFTEDGDNDTMFTNAPNDEASIMTTSDARRGLSFSVEYDNTDTSSIGYSTTNIVIDAGDEWNSGQEIGITLTDSDANTNSLSEETPRSYRSRPDHPNHQDWETRSLWQKLTK